jgi:hypothetical protein
MSCAEDIDTQKRGVVFVLYKTGPNQKFDAQAGRANIRMVSSLPGIMVVALHFCFDNPKFNPFLSLFLKTMDSFQKNMMVRVKMHHGKLIGVHTCRIHAIVLLTHILWFYQYRARIWNSNIGY